MSHLSSSGKLVKPIGDAGFKCFTWLGIFTFEDNIFISLSTIPDVYSSLSHVLYPTNYI